MARTNFENLRVYQQSEKLADEIRNRLVQQGFGFGHNDVGHARSLLLA